MNPSKLTDFSDLTEIQTLDEAQPIIEAAGYVFLPDWNRPDDTDAASCRDGEIRRQHEAGRLPPHERGDLDDADRLTSAQADYAAMLAAMIETRDAMTAHHLTPDLARHLNAAIDRATKWNK